jgi:prevent-host-death family protein
MKGKMMSVGIRELKNKLSFYLDKVRAGEKLAVTDRGSVVAYILPAAGVPAIDGLVRLVREEKASWGGGKPAGPPAPVGAKGKAVSEIVIEDRR